MRCSIKSNHEVIESGQEADHPINPIMINKRMCKDLIVLSLLNGSGIWWFALLFAEHELRTIKTCENIMLWLLTLYRKKNNSFRRPLNLKNFQRVYYFLDILIFG